MSERDYYPSQILTFSTNNRIATIQEKDKIWTYDYDVNEMRAKAVLEENGIVRLTKYYFSNYEKECTIFNVVLLAVVVGKLYDGFD